MIDLVAIMVSVRPQEILDGYSFHQTVRQQIGEFIEAHGLSTAPAATAKYQSHP
jgi:hypothetical protein